MIFVAFVATLFVGFGTAYLASEDVRYLTRAGLEETKILQGREPLERLIGDSALAPETRASLALVLEAREYAAGLGFAAKKTYTTYSDVGRDTLLLVLSASPTDCLCPHTWKYPIVGRIPYKGFFDPEMARKEAAKLDARGYDTYLRPASAFSTLGWFDDPLLSTALVPDSVELAALVFHEIAHNTLYIKHATTFNESFAQMAGYRAAEELFRSRGDTALARRAADRWHDEIVLGRFYEALATRLDTVYASRGDSAAVAAGRSEVARWARDTLEGPIAAELRTIRVGRLSDRPINNARIISARIYRTQLPLFEAWYQRSGGVARAVAELRTRLEGAEGDAAFETLARAVAEP